MGIEWFEGPAGDAVAVDDSFFPILIATFFGAATEPVIDAYFRWLHRMLERAIEEGVPMVNVTDSAPAAVPTARVRRLIAELTRSWGSANDKANVKVTSWVAVESQAIRQVLRVLEWLHGDMRAAYVATCELALEGALGDLARAGVAAPKGLVPARWQRAVRLASKLG